MMAPNNDFPAMSKEKKQRRPGNWIHDVELGWIDLSPAGEEETERKIDAIYEVMGLDADGNDIDETRRPLSSYDPKDDRQSSKPTQNKK